MCIAWCIYERLTKINDYVDFVKECQACVCVYTSQHLYTFYLALSKNTPPPKLDVRELAKMYKQRSLENLGRVRKGKTKGLSIPPSMLVRV